MEVGGGGLMVGRSTKLPLVIPRLDDMFDQLSGVVKLTRLT